MSKWPAIAAFIVIIGTLVAFALPKNAKYPVEPFEPDLVKVGAPAGPTWEEFIATIETEQANFLATYGDYVQVLDDGTILYKNKVINENRFKRLIPAGVSIHVYDSSSGKSFQVSQIYNTATTTRVRSYAIGPLAEEKTFDYEYIDP